jgi:predicted Zn-dependent protease
MGPAMLGLVLLWGCQSASVVKSSEKEVIDPARRAAMHLSEVFAGKVSTTQPTTTSAPASRESKINADAMMAYFEAKDAISGRDYKKAVSELQKAISLDPDYLPAHVLLMTIAFEQDDMTLAAKHARVVLKADSNDAMANYILGSALLDSKDVESGKIYLYRSMTGWNAKDSLPKLENLLAAFKLGGALASEGYLTATIEVYEPLLEELERLNGQANILDERLERMVEIYRPGLCLLLGEFSLKLQQYPQALKYFHRAQAMPAVQQSARLGTVRTHIAMGEKKQAEELLTKIAENDVGESVVEVYKMLRPDKWGEKIVSGYRPSEKNIDAALRLVRQLQNEKKFEVSILLLKKIQSVRPMDATMIWYQVKAYDAVGQDKQAVRTLIDSLSTTPAIFAGVPGVIDTLDSRLGKNLGKTLAGMDVAGDKVVVKIFLQGFFAQVCQDYSNAEKYYKQSVETDGRFLPAYVLWGHLLYLQRNWAGAISLADQAFAHDMKTGSLYFIKGRSLAQQGDLNGAVEVLEQAKKLSPGSDQILLSLVEVYLQVNNTTKAISVLKELISSQTAGPQVLIRMAQILMDSNTNDLAESILQNYVLRFGKDADYELLNARLIFTKDQDVAAYRDKLLELKDQLKTGVVERDLAELEYNVGNYDKAGKIVLSLLAKNRLIDPGIYQRIQQINALSHWKLLEYDIAEKAWLGLMHDWPGLRVSEVALARMYMDWQNYEKGLPLIESLLADETDESQKADIQTWLMTCYLRQDRIVDAMKVIDKWLVTASKDDRVRYLKMKIDALLEEKMYDETLAMTKELIGKNEPPITLWQQMQVTVLLAEDKPQDALEIIKGFSKGLPVNHPFIGGLKIQPLLKLKQYDQAIVAAKSVVESLPKDKKISAVFTLIQCYQQAGKYDEAMNIARKYLAENSESQVITYSLEQQIAHSMELAGQFDEAEKYILEQHDKSTGEIKNQWQQVLISTYFAAGWDDRAIKLLETILAVNPNLGWANNSLGYALANSGKDYKRAEMLIRHAIATEPGSGAYLDSLGWVLYRQEKFKQAYQYALMAHRTMDEPDPVISDHLGDICFELKKVDQAREYWQESIRASELRDSSSLEPNMPARTIKKLKRLK